MSLLDEFLPIAENCHNRPVNITTELHLISWMFFSKGVTERVFAIRSIPSLAPTQSDTLYSDIAGVNRGEMISLDKVQMLQLHTMQKQRQSILQKSLVRHDITNVPRRKDTQTI